MNRAISILLACILCLGLALPALAHTYEKDYYKDDYADQLIEIQKKLVELGYLAAKPDGWFGAKTQSAIKRFQLLNDLPETGTADQPFQELLFSGKAKIAPQILMSFAELKKLMITPNALGVVYDLSQMDMGRGEGAMELNNDVTMHVELSADDVTEIQLIGKGNVIIPFTMLLMALDSSIDTTRMYEALSMMVEEGRRHVNGMTITYEKDKSETQRLIVTPMESGTVE